MKLYQVIMEDNDYLDYDFVAKVLQDVFKRNDNDIFEMIDALQADGFLTLALLPFQFAETKVSEMQKLAEIDRVPVQCYFEETV